MSRKPRHRKVSNLPRSSISHGAGTEIHLSGSIAREDLLFSWFRKGNVLFPNTMEQHSPFLVESGPSGFIGAFPLCIGFLFPLKANLHLYSALYYLLSSKNLTLPNIFSLSSLQHFFFFGVDVTVLLLFIFPI